MRRTNLLLTGTIVIAITLAACTRPTGSDKPAPSPSPTSSTVQIPDEKRPRILAVGDSITGGYGVDLSEAYPDQLERLLGERGYPHKVINASGPGMTTRAVFGRLDAYLQTKPVLAIIELGWADKNGDGETKKNLAELIRRFQAGGAKVVLAGMETTSSQKLYIELAAEFGIPLIPDLRHGLSEVQGLAKDQVHCNAKGCQYMAEHNVLPVILPLLSKELP